MNHPDDEHDTAQIMGGLYGDGLIGLRQAFTPEWADALREDIEMLFAEAQQIDGGALPRGRNRFYVETHPERIRGFVDIATHPWFVAVCTAVLGPGYRIVEVGFDIPFPGAEVQPWHRDFPSPEATLKGRRLNSLAFNLTAVDTTEEMGPFEIALGTQWDDLADCPDPMFPPDELSSRYLSRAVKTAPQRGDISARSALTIHRGTANHASVARPVMVVGVDAPDGINHLHHDMQATSAYLAALPPQVCGHLLFREVDTIRPIIQHHTIPGLLRDANARSY